MFLEDDEHDMIIFLTELDAVIFLTELDAVIDRILMGMGHMGMIVHFDLFEFMYLIRLNDS